MTGRIMNCKTGWWVGDVIFRNREQVSGDKACHCVLVFTDMQSAIVMDNGWVCLEAID